jgi:acetyl/propionyl-CoA carboxylase alpha subunit
VLRIVGDKSSARVLAQAAGVPVFPGYAGDDQSDEALRAAAAEIGFPLLVKPAAGGGGKGMAVVGSLDELADALSSARRVAKAAFDDDRLILERYIEAPRHVEVQVLADAGGNVIHLGERDCSLQRRHQKVMEETPAPNLDEDVRAKLHAGAVAFAAHAGYVGAGTCEFLVASGGRAGFIEMNARLQVEHPVTELVCGLDLVELQLRVAMGQRLPLSQSDIRATGHAVEVRIYAEDPDNGFIPQAGRIEHVRWPADVRVDAGIDEGTDVPTHYDPLLAKIVAGGPDRAAALDALDASLEATEILGVATNIAFLRDLVADPVVRGGTVTTDWLERSSGAGRAPRRETDPLTVAVAAAAETERVIESRSRDPFTRLAGWRSGRSAATTLVPIRVDGEELFVTVHGTGPFCVGEITVERAGGCHGWVAGDVRLAAARTSDAWLVWSGRQHEIAVGVAPRRLTAVAAHLDSPLPGQVIAVHVEAGQQVAAGDELVVVEAMKMEHAISAPSDGVVRAVMCAAGDQVERGQPLVDFDPA